MKVGLFFGSFNPVHIGHLAIANYMLTFTDMDEVWLVLSPQNPLKDKKGLLNQNDRLHLINLALDGNPKIKVNTIEFQLPQPSYTINTLVHLKEKHPGKTFSLIMGQDNLSSLKKWKNYEQILANYHIYVYPRRENTKSEFDTHPHVHLTDAPLMEVSSTMIRNSIRDKKNVEFFLHPKVWDYIHGSSIYSK